jgi:hypothetical protein
MDRTPPCNVSESDQIGWRNWLHDRRTGGSFTIRQEQAYARAPASKSRRRSSPNVTPNTRPAKGLRDSEKLSSESPPWQQKLQEREQRRRQIQADIEQLQLLEAEFRDLDAPPAEKAAAPRRGEDLELLFSQIVMRNLRVFFQQNAVATRTAAAQQHVEGVSMAIFSREIRDQRLVSTGSRVLGVDIRRPFNNAMQLHGINARATSKAQAQTALAHAPAVPAVDLDFVFKFFHECELYTADKSRPKQRLNMTRYIAGKHRKLCCQPALVNGTKKDLVQLFWDSAVYKSWLQSGLPFAKPLSERQVEKCICKCMKEENIRECACTYCVVMKCLHRAFALLWKETQAERAACRCGSCGPGTPLQKSTTSLSDFIDQVTCPAVKYPDLALPHQPEHHPAFRPVRCCAKPRYNKKKALVGYFPLHVKDKCSRCGWVLLGVKESCFVMDSTKQVRWLAYLQTESKDGSRVRPVLRWATGTRRDLMDNLRDYLLVYRLHMWVHHWEYHQMQLDAATFPRNEIRVNVDYAATCELKAKDMKTCEHPTTANQLVALVLHTPGPTTKGQARPVICDCHRMWTNAKANCQGWHLLLQKIAARYQVKRIGVWSDGSSTQFKGAKNFVLNVEFFRKLGIEIWHNYPATAHGGGPVDNAGKQPRALIRADEKFERSRIYDYATCHSWCVKNYMRPRSKPSNSTWGINGNFYWEVCSNGKDAVGKTAGYEVQPGNDRKATGIPHTHNLYCVRTPHAVAREQGRSCNALSHCFVPCYCLAARRSYYQTGCFSCPHADSTGEFTTTEPRYKDTGDVALCTSGIVFTEAGTEWVVGFDGANLSHPNHFGTPVVYYYKQGTVPRPSQADMLFSTAAEVGKWIRDSNKARGGVAREARTRNDSAAGANGSGSGSDGSAQDSDSDSNSDSDERQEVRIDNQGQQDELLPPWLGEWNDDCEFCQDGGSLMLCFACCKVGHKSCVEKANQSHEYAPEGSSANPDWVCEDCWSELERNRASAAEAEAEAEAEAGAQAT